MGKVWEKYDVIRLAKEAGMSGLEAGGLLENFERFAELIAAHEREACAGICDLGWLDKKGMK